MARPTVIWQGDWQEHPPHSYTHCLRIVLKKDNVTVEALGHDAMGHPKWIEWKEEYGFKVLQHYILKTYEGVK